MTIEERARKAVSLMKIPFFSQPYEDLENSYIIGATEQHKIDIDKACLAFSKFLDYLLESNRITLEEREDYEWCDNFLKEIKK